MTIRDDVLKLRVDYNSRLGWMSDQDEFSRDKRVQVAAFIGELDAILMKNPKEKDEHE